MNITEISKKPWMLKLLFLKRLPMAFLAGLKIDKQTDSQTSIALKYGYLTQNPFGSLYFGCMAMAAELSTGLPAMAAIQRSGTAVSMLVVGMEARFLKKARGKVVFVCSQNEEIWKLINQAIESGQGIETRILSIGYDTENQIVAEFVFVWAFKKKK